jgi:hypothetical protein
MADECPHCGAPFSDRIGFEMGDSYEDVFGVPPTSLFAEYVRICPDPESAGRASRQSNVTVDVVLHRRSDFDDSPVPISD